MVIPIWSTFTFPTSITTNLTLREIYAHAHAKYKVPLTGSIGVFSPNVLCVSKKTTFIPTMKGTIDASTRCPKPIAQNDEKEVSEHYTIVDLISQRPEPGTTKVRLTKFREIDTIHTHHQTLLPDQQ